MTDMTMIERVARALCAREHPDANIRETAWRLYDAEYIASARAAIEAMREPPKSYMDVDPHSFLPGGWLPPNVVRAAIWREIIDAALSEHPNKD